MVGVDATLDSNLALIYADSATHSACRLDIELSDAFRRRYRIEKLLGAGGSSTVYLATDLEPTDCEHGVPVAIKVLTRLTSRLDVGRFLRESEFLARIDHVNVVSLRETGRESRHPYIVMDYAAGGTLRRLLRSHGRLPLTQAIDIAMDLLAGLSAMHAAGIVHRDLKPDNILLDAQGRARIADLGIAYDTVNGEPDCYEPGSLVGTPRYMAPEQAIGEKARPQSDLYNVGLILYEMLSGEPPFPGNSADDLLRAHLTAPVPPLADSVPWIPPALAALIARSLAKRFELRPESSAAFRAELAGCRPTTGPAISRPTYRLAIDREVLVRARQSNRSAVELLYHEYASLVRAYLLRSTGPMGLRERTFAVFRLAHQYMPRADAPVSFAHWLLRIAAHVADAIPS